MKILYKDNPLATTIELEEHEKREFWLKIKIQELEYLLECAWYETTREQIDNDKIKKIVNIDYWCADDGKSKLDNRVDELYDYLISDLKGVHCGDCTCIPCSCSKCHAEDLLGICTIDGLPKHSASIIADEFKKHDSIDLVIDSLENYVPDRMVGGWSTATDERWESVAPKFIEQAAFAAEWLKKYKMEKLNEN